ncbi:protein associated with UVRAG as autophagy enhancer isoform X2 [Corvus cornix cornix]|uniref:protein associated with UVRAG as autophagy enhancer isoform X2 n=1 Tax=Corvus cornix cornix TaxID=932674 RepID=UPI0009AF0162|nr:protein associated with UVRAG as autophagy enhancer isoform X2 [Corvus cornix cornix]
MSLHAVALASFSRTEVFKHPYSGKLNHESLKVAFTNSACSSNPSVRISCLAPTPQISVLSDESSRPAVIGHAGSFGSYPGSAEAIKDILVSVLNASGLKPSLVLEQSTMQAAEHPDSDVEQWEESSTGDSHDDSDSDSAHHNSACAQTDIRFTRPRACWNNADCDSPKPSLDTFSCPHYTDGDPAASSLSGFTLSGMSPLKRDCFTQVTLTGGTVTSAVLHSGKESYTSPERDLAFTRLLPDSTVGKADLVKYPYAVEPASLSNSDSDSPSGPSQSEPVNPTGSTSSLNISAIPLNRSLQDICMLPEDVEKENAHFFVADMIIASLEKMKCNILSQQQAESWGVEETSGSDGSYHTDSELSSYLGVKKSDSSVTSSDSGYEELEDLENLSVTPDKRSSFEPGSNSAEATAQELCRAFRKYWLQTDSAVQLSGCLSSSKQRSVLKEEIPRELESSLNLAEEIKIISKLRGSSGWSPPRSQIIFNIHPSVKRDAVVAAQNFTCVGCGTPIESKYIRRLRYCDYLGKYFCDCCHSYAQSSIPARILSKWDFKKYYVCNFSKHLLDSIWQHPIFNVSCINKTLYTKSKEMDRVREVQEQLFHLKKLLKTCRFAESVLKEFEQVPSHLTEELHLFSLDDLVKIKRGQLLPLLKDILKSSTSHVDGCELCQAKGFICEFCQSADLLFPYQTAKCKRCTECKTCFHKACFKSGGCPKCLRISARRTLSETPSLVPQ